MPVLGLPESSTPLRPAHFDIERAIRSNILALHPYRCARDDYQDGILLDANENALGHSIVTDTIENNILTLPLHRYPDPSHDQIKSRIAGLRGLPGPRNVFLGVGSDEVIDLLQRVCVHPGREQILITPPTYGMYAVCAQVNDVGVVKVPLELEGVEGEGGEKGRFSLKVDEIKKAVDADPSIRLIFLCSPGNPTGTLLSLSAIRSILEYPGFTGVVVVDEAYIDFAGAPANSAVSLIPEFANLVVMQTLSKGFGLAAIRLGIALAQPPIIQVLTNTKAPYNISTPTATLAVAALSPASLSSTNDKIDGLLKGRTDLLVALEGLRDLGVGPALGGNDANFVVVPILSREGGAPDNKRAVSVYKSLAEEKGVVVRYRGSEPGCEGALRITVGSEEENRVAVEKLREALSVL